MSSANCLRLLLLRETELFDDTGVEAPLAEIGVPFLGPTTTLLKLKIISIITITTKNLK